MLRKIKPYLVNIIVVIVVLTIAVINLFPFLWTSSSYFSSVDHNTSFVTGEPVTADTGIPPDTLLTYQAFRQYEDDQMQKKNYRQYINRGTGNSMTLFFIGSATTAECDTCSGFKTAYGQETTRHYLLLPGYAFSDNNTLFYRKQGSNFLQVTRWDSSKQHPNGYKTRYGHYEQKQVPFRFRPTVEENILPQKGAIMIPISTKTYNILNPVIRIAQPLMVIFLLYIMLAWPAKMLIRISRGEIFTHQNIRQLNIIAGIFLIAPFATILLQYLMKWSFHRYLTPDVSLQPLEILIGQQIFLFLGLIVLAIAKAFRKGMLLQEEQNLTV